MKNVLVWGTSFKKVADEAQLLAHHQIITTYCPGAKITYLTRPRREVAEKYPDIDIVPFSNLLSAVRIITKSDLLVIGGGPFYDEFPQLVKCALLLIFSKLLKIPILIYGVTVFPIQSWWAKTGYRLILSNVNNIVVRDHASYEALINIGVPPKDIQAGTDLRYILDVHKSDEIENILKREGVDINKPIISISTRYFDQHMPEWVKTSHGFDDQSAKQTNQAFAKVINHLSTKGQLVLIPMHPYMDEDIETARAIQNEMDDPSKLIVLKSRYQVAEILGIIKASQMLVTGRVGSVLFASITATPVLGIAYDSRTLELMHDLELQDYVFDWKSLTYEQLAAASEKLLQNRENISKTLHRKADEFQLKAKSDSMVYKYWLEK